MRQFLLYILTFLSVIQLYSQTINVTIDWNNSTQTIPDHAYGVNSSANFIPSYSNDPVFMRNLERITQKKGLVRLHGWGMIDETSPESWLDNGIWNSSKIRQALLPLQQQGYEVMINIPSGPLGENDYQNPQAFAKFCADLVQIANIDHQLGVKYWEIPNEREQGFADPGLTVSQMSTLIQTASKAMKAVDPTIKVGGATTAWVNIPYLTQLVQVTPDIDFITCHTYSGDCSNSLQNIYDIAQFAVDDLNTLRKEINKITTDPLPIFLTEYNLSFQGCKRIQSNEGAVYDAIIMTESVKAGINGTFYWNVAPYSDMSILNGDLYDNNAYLFETFNTYFHGNMVQSTSTESSKILAYSTINQDSKNYSFCLINRTASVQNVQVKMSGITPNNIDEYLWDAQNSFLKESTNWSNLNNGSLVISPYSVNLFTGEFNALSISDNLDKNKTILFPNPSNGVFHLSNDATIKTFKVYSQYGSMVKFGKVKNFSINLTNYASGIYNIIVFNENGNTSTVKVIKK